MLSPKSSMPLIRIGIYRTSSLGDVVLASACLDYLSTLPFPTEITWIGRGASLEMLALSWPEVRCLEFSRSESAQGISKILDQLKDYHLLIDLQGNMRSRWFGQRLRRVHGVRYHSTQKSQIARNRLILEARMRGRRRPLPKRCLESARPQFRMMVDTLKRGLREYLQPDQRLGIEHESYRPQLPTPDLFDPPWRKELRFGAWLGIAPGAAHPTKEAPLDLVAETILNVERNLSHASEVAQVPSYPLGLVFFGDQNDREKARLLLDRLQWKGPVLNLAGRLSLWESSVALREIDCLLSNDSSLSHIAEAVDTPTAVLFGPTVEAFGFAPRMRQSRAFSSQVGCRPCSKHGKLACRYGDKLCFTTLCASSIAGHLAHIIMISNSNHPSQSHPPKTPGSSLQDQRIES
jgi:ADP-heptose:LPS heptosyltransferase